MKHITRGFALNRSNQRYKEQCTRYVCLELSFGGDVDGQVVQIFTNQCCRTTLDTHAQPFLFIDKRFRNLHRNQIKCRREESLQNDCVFRFRNTVTMKTNGQDMMNSLFVGVE